MGLDSPKNKPMFERTERWASSLTASAASDAVSRAFSARNATVDQDGNAVRIRCGSNWQYRLWGNLFPAGRQNIPVALVIEATPAAEGSVIEAHAFDTFGFRLVEKAFFGAKETFEERLEELLAVAAAAAKVESRS
ncbi:hypothetical protein PV772_06640 [Pseudarthrobacter sp. CC12]|uniref:hypothetical protein n=1 Tax=Pseudarthrobacter sp. CC12 TaxID=3029193 RepID=UPI003267560B